MFFTLKKIRRWRQQNLNPATLSPSGLPLYSAKRAEHYHMKRSAQLVPRKSASRHPPMAPIGARSRHPLPLRLPLYSAKRAEH